MRGAFADAGAIGTAKPLARLGVEDAVKPADILRRHFPREMTATYRRDGTRASRYCR